MRPRGNWSPNGRAVPGVYFIVGADLVKIGCTGSTKGSTLEMRVRTLQMMSPVPVELHRFVPQLFQGYRLEGQLHRRYDAARRHGEWFGTEILDEVDPLADDDLVALAATDSVWTPIVANTMQPR